MIRVREHFRRYPVPKQPQQPQVKLCICGCGMPATHSNNTLAYRCHMKQFV